MLKTNLNTAQAEMEVSDEIQEETHVTLPEIELPASGSSFPIAQLEHELARKASEESTAVEMARAGLDQTLPKTLKASLDLLAEVKAVVPKSKLEAKGKANRLAILTNHIHALSQGPTAPPLDYKSFFRREPPAEALAYVSSKYPRATAGKKP